MSFLLQPLPLPASIVLETPAVLRQLARSHRHLAELKGAAATIPNEAILIDTGNEAAISLVAVDDGRMAHA